MHAVADDTLRFKVSEIFDSVQGEGPSAGTACTFLRLAGCNLRCSYCDTAYSWDWTRYEYAAHVVVYELATLVERLSSAQRLVVTGGEPLLQQRHLRHLFAALPETLTIEIETNGTVTPDPALCQRVNQWNVSPKLANSGEPAERRVADAALRALRDTGRAWLKFVVTTTAEADEALNWANELGWPLERTQLMPLAATRAELAKSLPVVRTLARERGVWLSPRLHIERWDGRRGV